MIPDLPEGISSESQLDFFDKLAGNLTDQSTVHIHWWTHRQNPSVCWVCDIVTLLSKILEITQEIYPKSSTDMQTDESSDSESISEIEENLNVNEEEPSVEPEYDVEEEDVDS